MDREEREDLIAELLSDLAETSGIPLEEIMASEFEEPLSNFEVFDIYEEETDSEPLDLEQEYGDMDIDDYLDDYVDDYDVADEQDSYGEEAL